MGYPMDLFLDRVNDEFICGLCNSVLKEPCSLVPCHHTFCWGCLDKLGTANRKQLLKCPLTGCQQRVKDYEPPPWEFIKELGRLRLYCPYSHSHSGTEDEEESEDGHGGGCEAILRLKHADDHNCVKYLKELLKEQDQEIRRSRAEAEKLRDKVRRAHDELRKQDDEIREKDEEITDKDEEIRTLREKIGWPKSFI